MGTGVCEIVYWDESIQLQNTGIRVRRHRYTSSTTPVYEFTDTGIRVHRHRYTSSQTPVYEFIDTGIRVHRHRTRGIEFRRSVEISDNLPKLGHCKNYSATMLFSADLQWAGTLYLNWDSR